MDRAYPIDIQALAREGYALSVLNHPHKLIVIRPRRLAAIVPESLSFSIWVSAHHFLKKVKEKSDKESRHQRHQEKFQIFHDTLPAALSLIHAANGCSGQTPFR